MLLKSVKKVSCARIWVKKRNLPSWHYYQTGDDVSEVWVRGRLLSLLHHQVLYFPCGSSRTGAHILEGEVNVG